MPSSILEKITQADNLQSMPAVAIQVLSLTRQENVNVDEIARTIEQDPALTAKILKTVNSALFGVSQKISSLPQAMMMLGLRTVKVLALSFSLVTKFGGKEQGDFNSEEFWKRSLTTAVSGRLLAEQCDPAVSDEAFVAGLLADVGILAAMQHAGREYGRVIEAYKPGQRPLHEIEAEVLGMTHAVFSAALLRAWHLPPALAGAAEHHHDPEPPLAVKDDDRLTPLIWTAARISDLFCNELPSSELNTVKGYVAAMLASTHSRSGVNSPEAEVDKLLHLIDERVRETAARISLEIGKTTSYQELHSSAMAELAQLSMSAELDRAIASRKAVAAEERIESLSSEKQALAIEAQTDELTQLANRKSFNDTIRRAVDESRRNNKPLGLIMMDLDHFKDLNDTYGHLFGDEVLKVIGQTLKKAADATHHVSRYGGEEFAVICMQSTIDELNKLTNLIREETERITLQYGTQTIRVTASFGAALGDPQSHELTVDHLIHDADSCLLKAKRTGRNRAIIADPTSEPVRDHETTVGPPPRGKPGRSRNPRGGNPPRG